MMDPSSTRPTAALRKRRAAWATDILSDIARIHIGAKGLGRGPGEVSLRDIATVVGLSHQSPMTWVTGKSVPSPEHALNLAKLAKRDPMIEVLRVEALRCADVAASRLFTRAADRLMNGG